MSNYYRNQLERLNTNCEYPCNLQIKDGEGNMTNCMDLNPESVPVFIEWLKEKYIDQPTDKMKIFIWFVGDKIKGFGKSLPEIKFYDFHVCKTINKKDWESGLITLDNIKKYI